MSSTGPAAPQAAPAAAAPRRAPAALRNVSRALGLAFGAAPAVTAAFVLTLLVLALVPLALAWLTKVVLDGLASRAPMDDLVPLAVALAGVGLLAGNGPHVQAFLHAQLERSAGLLALERLYGAVNRLHGLAHFESPTFLDRLRLAQQSTSGTTSAIVLAVFGLVGSVLTIAGFLTSLLVISPAMVVAVLVGTVPTLAAELVIARRRAALMWSVTPAQRREMVFSMMLADVDTAKEVRLFGIGDFLLGKVRENRRSADAEKRRLDVSELRLQLPPSLVSAAVSGGALVWALVSARAGHLSIGDVTLFVGAVAGIQTSATAGIQSIAQAQQSLLVFGHYVDVLETPADLPVAPRPVPLPPLTTGIRLEDVWFRYAPDLPWVLRGVDLTIPFGTSLAVVGENGSGKSTLVKLLCRLYDPTRGRILWDGVDLRDVDPVEFRRRLGVVFQDFVHYDLTAAENISMGVADQEQTEQAARRAGVHDVVRALPQGYQTALTRVLLGGDGTQEDPGSGVSLSGGQWQRIAIARAFARDTSELLVLDEPSSGLDARAEHEIHRGLREHRHGRTSVLISHRLGALRTTDCIVVLQGGQVAESGTHDSLVARGGAYAALYDLQSSDYRDGAAVHLADLPAVAGPAPHG